MHVGSRDVRNALIYIINIKSNIYYIVIKSDWLGVDLDDFLTIVLQAEVDFDVVGDITAKQALHGDGNVEVGIDL